MGRCPHCRSIFQIPAQPAASTPSKAPDFDLSPKPAPLVQADPLSPLEGLAPRPDSNNFAGLTPVSRPTSATDGTATAAGGAAGLTPVGGAPAPAGLTPVDSSPGLTPTGNETAGGGGSTPVGGGLAPVGGLTPAQGDALPTLTPVGPASLTPVDSGGLTPLGNAGGSGPDNPYDWASAESNAAPAVGGGLSSSPNPFASPTSSSMGKPQKPISSGDRSGLPWERNKGDAKLSRTAKMVLLNPSDAFSRMRCTGGLGSPMGYLCLTMAIAIAAIFGWALVGMFAGLGLGLASAENVDGERLAAAIGGSLVTILISAVISIGIAIPGVILNSFIQAGVLHVILMMLGGARRGFETTYRVVCFSLGSSVLIYVIPCVSYVVAPIFMLIALIVGLSRAHEISGGKAALAIFAPVLIVLPIMVLLGIMVGALSGG